MSSLDRLIESHQVSVRFYAFELRPPEMLPVSEEYKMRIMSMRPQFNAVAQEQYGLSVNPGPFGINSRPALIGSKYAQSLGLEIEDAYHKGILHAYWQAAADISDEEVLRQVAEDAGMQGEAYLAALESPQWQQALIQDVSAARQMGIQGVPALLFNQKYFISGAQPYAVLVEALEEIRKREREA